MRIIFTICFFFLFYNSAIAQVPVSEVNTINSQPTGLPYVYVGGSGEVYLWNENSRGGIEQLTGFSAGGDNYIQVSEHPGNLVLRRVNNAEVNENITSVWAKSFINNTTGKIYTIQSQYENNMSVFMNHQRVSQGAENIFTNTGNGANNIERIDWIMGQPYTITEAGKVGFVVFDRTSPSGYHSLCIAAITSLDGGGNPATYGNIVRVVNSSYGPEVADNVEAYVYRGITPGNLFGDETTGTTAGAAGTFISLESLGLTTNEDVYGYSLFAADLPMSATPSNLVNYQNNTFFPTTTGTEGGLDLLSVFGLFGEEQFLLPTRFISFDAVQNNGVVKLQWEVENEASAEFYEVQRSSDGQHFETISTIQAQNATNDLLSYSYTDQFLGTKGNQLYYRIKLTHLDHSYIFSRTLSIKKNYTPTGLSVYPNPVANTLYIVLSSPEEQVLKYYITNQAGQQIVSRSLTLSKGTNTLSVSETEKLSAGIYYITIKDQQGNKNTRQFLKK